MKKVLIAVIVWIFSASALYADEEKRFIYYPEDKAVFDSETGKLYQFRKTVGEFRYVEIDYLKGTAKVVRELPLREGELLES